MTIIGTKLFPFNRKHTCCKHHHPHAHAPVGQAGQKVNLLDLLLVGFTNGLIPCPSALAVLLMSLSTGHLFQGLLLVLAFGVGGAAALITVGIIFVKLSALAGKSISAAAWSKFSAASSLLIIGTGIAITYQAVQKLL
jgi:ABC-type nickel/cobalt efflux system permease component RcnA